MIPVITFGLRVKSLRRFLAAKAQEKALEAQRTAGISPYSQTPEINLLTISALELFDEINISGLSEMGQIANAYEAEAYTISLEAGVDASFEALGSEIGLEAVLGASGSMTNFRFHVLQLQPHQLHMTSYQYLPDGQRSVYTEILNNPRPVFMGYFMGKQWSVGVKAELSAGVDFQPKELGDVVESFDAMVNRLRDGESVADDLALNITISAKVEGGYSRTFLSLTDNLPSFYSNLNDPNLRNELEANIGVGGRNEILTYIISWLTTTYRVTPGPFDLQKQQICDMANSIRRIDFFGRTFYNLSTNNLIRALNAAANLELAIEQQNKRDGRNYSFTNQQKIQHFKFLVGIVISNQFVSNAAYDITKIQAKLVNLGFVQVQGAPGMGRFEIITISGQQAIRVYCASLQQRFADLNSYDSYLLTFFKSFFSMHLQVEKEVPGQPNKLLRSVRLLPNPLYYGKSSDSFTTGNKMAFLAYWGHNPSAAASLNATIMDVGLVAGVEACAKYATYRFQTFASRTETNFFFTQDVKVVYKQLCFGAQVPFKQLGEFCYNTISYNAAICNWHSTDNTSGGWQIGDAQDGSGLAFGFSLSKKTILKWASLPDTDKFKLKVARSLYLTVAELNSFISLLIEKFKVTPPQPLPGAPATTVADTVDFGATSIILESSFKANNTCIYFQRIQSTDGVRYQLDPTIRQSWLTHFQTQQAAVLQTPGGLTATRPDQSGPYFSKCFLRARIREADAEESNMITFRLGIPAGPVNLKLELSAVKKVGKEGMVDLFTYDLINRCEYANGASSYANPAIAPVSLFYQ